MDAPSALFSLQGSLKRRQFAESIYYYETALPENLLQRGIGPLGDTKRLLKVFHKLLTGMLCALIALVMTPPADYSRYVTLCTI